MIACGEEITATPQPPPAITQLAQALRCCSPDCVMRARQRPTASHYARLAGAETSRWHVILRSRGKRPLKRHARSPILKRTAFEAAIADSAVKIACLPLLIFCFAAPRLALKHNTARRFASSSSP